MAPGPDAPRWHDSTLALDRSFSVLGQRHTVDSHTFVNVTYDRVEGRLMPNPLDAAFAALGNNAALPLLASELDNESYVQGLAKTRTLVDAHESGYWEGSIYTRWLGALRSLSPGRARVPAWPLLTASASPTTGSGSTTKIGPSRSKPPSQTRPG